MKYINELIKKFSLDMDEVGNYIVVVPGGLKFMKMLLGLIRLVQIEAIKGNTRTEWLDLPVDKIFDAEKRQQVQIEYKSLQDVHQQRQKVAQKELKAYRKKTEMLNYYIRGLESHLANTPYEQIDDSLTKEVEQICGKMQQVMVLVSDLEKTCGSGPDIHNDPFERLNLSNAISRTVEHHKWLMSSEEYTHKINCGLILDVASRILGELNREPIEVADLNPFDVVKQNHDMALFLRNLSTTEWEVKLYQCQLKQDENQHKENLALHPQAPVVFPERDLQLLEFEDYDLEAFYAELQRRPDILSQPVYRLALDDVIPENTITVSPPGGKSMNLTNDRSMSSSLMTAQKKGLSTTVRKRTKAMSVLKTISRGTKKSKVNMEALKELAKNGFNESMLDSSTITWKKKSVNVSCRAEVSQSESMRPGTGNTRLSGLFSDSMVPKFNSTAIFNSTTNEQAQQMVFNDITNKEAAVVKETQVEEKSLLKQVRREVLKL